MRRMMRCLIVGIVPLLLLPHSSSAVEETWQYTLTDPGKGWERLDCVDDHAWKTGKAGFGKHGTPGGHVFTEWHTPDIWMRRSYVLKADQNTKHFSLEVCHDEDFEVYINGVLAAQDTGHYGNYKIYPISPEAMRVLQVGKNVLAVHCHQTAGGQFIDVGFTEKSEPFRANPRKAKPRVAPMRLPVDVDYTKQATWVETMLAIRAGLQTKKKTIDMAYGSALAWEFWRDFPHQTDWLMQDSAGKMSEWVDGYRDGKGDITGYFQLDRDASLERNLIDRVLTECGVASESLQQERNTLIDEKIGPDDPRWLNLYVRACRIRRCDRLQPLLEKTDRVIFAKHHNMGGGFFAYTEYTNWGGNQFGGLFRIDLDNEKQPSADFAVITELISTNTGGVLRDPALSYDAKRLLFAWRQDAHDRDYKIFEMELATGKTRLITGADTYGASYEPCYLPDGNILFNSSRVVQSVDCAGPDVSNLFICDADGKHVRRVGFDQVHTPWPCLLDDGRVVYTRWDYNDRSQIYPQGLFQMNPDGTGQTEYYGNNTWSPTTFFHPQGIPGTGRVMVALGGHHNPQCGKLGIVDISRGRQEADGVIELPTGKKPAYQRADRYAQTGDQYSYPFPLDDSSLLVSYDPIGYHLAADGRRLNNKDDMRFHLYFMTFDGRREVLSADMRISSFQPIPLIPRSVPRVLASSVNYRKSTGTLYMQDIYEGPGLKGIPRGTIKRLRVVEIRYREMNIGRNSSSGPGGRATVVTPIAIGTGAWDVKAILGDATVYEDGSALFDVPARTPVYFQALNEKNQVIQTMRSWVTLMPGEQMSCVGCHEVKNGTPLPRTQINEALAAGRERLIPFYGPVRGFSFTKEVQPILDKHCVKCHIEKAEGKDYLLTGVPVLDSKSKRYWSRSYMTLTRTKDGESRGEANEWVNWISNSSEPSMIPPQHGGSTRSQLITLLENDHYDVELSHEKMETLSAWIDLVVPFCGDYMEANAWNEQELKNAQDRLELRRKMDRLELQSIQAMLDNSN